MIKNIKDKIPVDMFNSYQTLKSLRDSKDEWHFNFMEASEYIKIVDLGKSSQIYWTEMLNRIYIITLVSCFKALRWIEAVDNNYNNYYGFCSSLRGLIESIADSFYTLRSVPLTIATDFRVVKEQINNNSRFITIHEKLENELLHYIQGTKIRKEQSDQYPKYFNSKPIQEYISKIDDSDKRISFLYSYLCGISHPAHESTQIFLFLYKGETIVCNDSINHEIEMSNVLLEGFCDALTNLFRAYMNNITTVFLLLNEFDIDSIYTSISFEETFKNNGIWDEVKDFCDKSEKKYTEALKNEKYY